MEEGASSNPIGASTWIWYSPITHERLADLAPRLRGWGFDVVELPIEDPTDWQPRWVAGLLANEGLGATTCAVASAGRDLTLEDRSTTQRTQDYLRTCAEMAAEIGAGVVAGPVYAPVGRRWRLNPDQRRDTIARLAEALAPVAAHAVEHGVTLALEPLNRFETSLINTVEQAVELVREVNSPGLGVCLDTFHMNIEEKDPVAATLSARGHIAHVQACGTDRGTPGADRFDWPGFAAALKNAGYAGSLCIESFTGDNEAIAMAASVWRPLAPSQDQLATDGLAFLRQLLGQDS